MDTDAVDSCHLELIQQPDNPAAVGMAVGGTARLRREGESPVRWTVRGGRRQLGFF